MKNTRFHAVITCLLAVPIWGTAMASPVSVSSSSAYVDGLRYRLVDLDAHDGVTPWIKFNGEGNIQPSLSMSMTPIGQVSSSNPDRKDLVLPGALFSDAQSNLVSRDGLVSIGKQGQVLSASTGVEYNASALSDLTSHGLGVRAGSGNSWTLSPKTALVLEGSANVMASVDMGPFGTNKPLLFDDLIVFSNAAVFLELNMDNADGLVGPDPHLSVQDRLDLQANAGYYGIKGTSPSFFPDDSEAKSFSLSVSNTADGERTGELRFFIKASGGVYADLASSVPESGTGALALSGLLGVAALARRRRC